MLLSSTLISQEMAKAKYSPGIRQTKTGAAALALNHVRCHADESGLHEMASRPRSVMGHRCQPHAGRKSLIWIAPCTDRAARQPRASHDRHDLDQGWARRDSDQR